MSVELIPSPRPIERTASIELARVGLRFRRWGDRHPTLKHRLLAGVRRGRPLEERELWLFEGLDLEIGAGERVGIIGANGAGKSTLLKLIGGIYPPTRGEVRVRGRVAPLIELGAGLSPELSGRENIFLLGALLGFSRASMVRKLEGILEFAGLGEFADTPVKYFSTGMFQRLAFSIATDVDPEVLLIDEVFAGGDADFVRRATARMHALMEHSHLVVMVSHRMPLLRQLMNRVLWIKDGQVLRDGEPEPVIAEYLAWQEGRAERRKASAAQGESEGLRRP